MTFALEFLFQAEHRQKCVKSSVLQSLIILTSCHSLRYKSLVQQVSDNRSPLYIPGLLKGRDFATCCVHQVANCATRVKQVRSKYQKSI